MNPFLLSLLGSLLRTAIITAGGYGVAKGTVSQQDVSTASSVADAVLSGSTEAVTGAIAVGAGLGLSIWQKVKAARAGRS